MSQRKAWAAFERAKRAVLDEQAQEVSRQLGFGSPERSTAHSTGGGKGRVRPPTPARPKGSKYGAVRTNGYASKKEAARAAELKLLERSGAIRDLREQVRFELLPKTDSEHSLTYVADFTYWCEGVQVVEDVKGVKTAVYKIKRRLMLHFHGIEIRET